MGTGYSPAVWSNFFSALVSAGAALTGLLFVAISINLQRILGAPQLVARAGKALATAMLLPVVAVVCLTPEQTRARLGWEVLILSVAGSAGVLFLHWKANRRNTYITALQKVMQTTVMLASTVPFGVAGLSLIFGRGGGLYWVTVGAVAAILAPVIDAWVLLVEIQR